MNSDNIDADVMNKVQKLLKSHVSQEWGITNDLVQDIAATLCPGDTYKGLYMPDQLSRIVSMKSVHRPFTLIVNVGRHFVTIYCHDNYVLYLDPYGIPCVQPHVRQFLNVLSPNIFFNETKIQTVRSKHCGLYAILFAQYYDVPLRDFKLKFIRNPENDENDDRCIFYLHKLNKDRQ